MLTDEDHVEVRVVDLESGWAVAADVFSDSITVDEAVAAVGFLVVPVLLTDGKDEDGEVIAVVEVIVVEDCVVGFAVVLAIRDRTLKQKI